MAFDISTARPEKSGFDISTARPESAQQPAEQPQQDLQSDVPLPPEEVAALPEMQKNMYFRGAEKQNSGIPISESDIQGLKEIGAAPEFNQLSLDSMKASLAANLMSDPFELARVLNETMPNSSLAVDPEGNVRLKLPSGEYAINRPGFSGQDVAQFGTRMAAFSALPVRGGMALGTLGKVAFESAITESGLQAAEKALGGDFDISSVAFAGGGAAAGQTIAPFIRGAVNQIKNKQAIKLLKESAPSVQTLKEAAHKIYQSVDDLGVKIKPSSYQSLASDISSTLKKEGLSELTPDSSKLLDILQKENITNLSVSRLETLRKIAGGVADSQNKADARLGKIAISKIDDFIENIENSVISPEGAKIAGQPVGQALRDARNLWGRARRSELVKQAIDIGSETRRSGIDLGLRNEFNNLHRKILKGTVKGFTKDEVDAIKKIANGTSMQNAVFQMGRLGIPADQATNSLMLTLVGGLGGAMAGGVSGGIGTMGGVGLAVGIPTIMRNAATKMTQSNAALADDIVRSSGNGLSIVKAYLKNVPKSKRSSAELASLLLNNNIAPESIKKTGNYLIDDAAFALKNAIAIEAAQAGEE